MLLEEPLSNDRPAKASSMLAVPLSLPSSTSSKDALELRASDADRADAPRERDAISCDAELINVLIRVWTFLLLTTSNFHTIRANFHSNTVFQYDYTPTTIPTKFPTESIDTQYIATDLAAG
jgi:hypothetical protein